MRCVLLLACLQVGYVQGMGFVSAILLMYMSEEAAFWTLVALLKGVMAGEGGAVVPTYLCQHACVVISVMFFSTSFCCLEELALSVKMVFH